MASRNNKRTVRKTLLIVGEGPDEKAFLGQLKSLYSKRFCREISLLQSESLYSTDSPKITLISANEKGPENIIGEAIAHKRNHGYDKTVVLLDTDIEWKEKIIKQARKKEIVLVGSEPCLEGLLLKILDKSVPDKSRNCKIQLQNMLPGKSTETRSYASLFPKELLDKARNKVEPLNILISYIIGEK